jgi:hypothetical protein
MLQNANVSHGKTMMGKVEGRRELPCVRRLMSLHILHKENVVVVRRKCHWEKKGDQEEKKKQRKKIDGTAFFYSPERSFTSSGGFLMC